MQMWFLDISRCHAQIIVFVGDFFPFFSYSLNGPVMILISVLLLAICRCSTSGPFEDFVLVSTFMILLRTLNQMISAGFYAHIFLRF